MYTLDEVPTKEGAIMGNLSPNSMEQGVVGVKSGYEVIKLFPAALKVLQNVYNDEYPGMRLAAASSADTPKAVEIGRL